MSRCQLDGRLLSAVAADFRRETLYPWKQVKAYISERDVMFEAGTKASPTRWTYGRSALPDVYTSERGGNSTSEYNGGTGVGFAIAEKATIPNVLAKLVYRPEY